MRKSQVFSAPWALCIIATMGWRMQKVAVCDVCGHVWIPSVPNPKLCASKKCRSTLWDKGGVDGRTREAKKKVGHTTGIAKGRTSAGKSPRKA